jgi:hypothetical protein
MLVTEADTNGKRYPGGTQHIQKCGESGAKRAIQSWWCRDKVSKSKTKVYIATGNARFTVNEHLQTRLHRGGESELPTS